MKKTKETLLTVSVAIPAFNEQVTIERLLISLVSQNQHKYSLKSITVYSDRSTDTTDKKVTDFSRRNPLVRLKVGKVRVGKYYRLNDVFTDCDTDVLVVLDADIALSGKNFLEALVEKIRSDSNSQMISAHQILIRPSGIIGLSVYTFLHYGDRVRWSFTNLNNGVNFYNSATAFRGSFARSLHIPDKLTDPHLYLYLAAAKIDGYRYCTDAIIFQQPITTFSDYLKLLRRPLGKKDANLERLFNVTANEVYSIPIQNKITGIVKCFIDEPVFTFPAILLILFSKFYVRFLTTRSKSSLWEIAASTKKTI